MFFFCGGGGRFFSEPMTKAFRPTSNDFSLFLLWGWTHTTPAAAVFVQPDKQQWPTKNAYKNRRSCIYFLLLSFTCRTVASSTTAACSQPTSRWTMVNRWERKERENGCTIGALFSLWTFTHFYEEKKMINDGRVMCRTAMPLCAAAMNEWRVAAPCLCIYIQLQQWHGDGIKRKLRISYFKMS